MLPISSRSGLRRWGLAGLLVTALWMTGLPRLEAGTGRFKDGVFDFCVSVRFNATEEQLQSIRAGFQAASGVLFDATDGQHSFGKITILNNSGGSDVAEYWVNEESGRAYATSGNYGVRGEHVMLYMPDNFAADDPQGNAYTIAHEHAHHSYGLYDEYKGWDDPTSATPTEVDAECAAPAAEGQNLSYCLMDNYFTRGGSYTLNEFCITGNHDPDRDTDQSQQRNGDGCWTTLSGHPTRSANAPAGTPVDAAAAAPMVEFATSQNVLGAGDLRVMLVIDRSGSMADERKIQFARTGAILFSLFVKDGQGLGLVQFNSTSQSLVPLQVVSPAVRSGVLGPAIRGITPSGGTDIGAGLERALVEFTANAAGGCSDIIVLLSDGDGTLNQSTIDKLKDAAVSVLAIGIGAGLSTTGQAKLQDVAKQTGGQYFRGINPSELIAFFLLSVMESRGNTPISRSPMNLGPNAAVSSEVMIEPGVESATFAVAADTDNGVTGLRLRSPSGQVITEASAGANGITVIVEEGSHSIEVENPEPGDWTVTTETGAAGSGEAELLVFAEHDGVRLSVTVAESEVDFPNPITVFATPRFDGAALLGAAISGVVEQPAGGRVPIALLDNGSPLNGDKLAGDGVYSASFATFAGEGTYTFSLTASGQNARTHPGEPLFRDPTGISDEVASKPVPNFNRVGSATSIVRGAPAVNRPRINAGGTVDAASFRPNLSRGGISSLFGVDLAGSTRSASGIPLPTEIDGVQVRVNGVLAPLFFISPNQINFQLPFEAPLNGMVMIEVIRNGAASAPVQATVAAYAPAVFVNPNTGEPIITRPDGSLVTSASPAQPGEVLIIYLTGIGDVTNPPATGAAAVVSPLSAANLAPTVTAAGLPAQVFFAGLSPFFVGLGQINIRLPDSFAALALLRALEGQGQGTGTVPLVINFGGASSVPVDLPAVGAPTTGGDISVEMVEVLPPQALASDIVFLSYEILSTGLTGGGERDLYLSTDSIINPGQDTLVNTRTVNLTGGDEILRSTSNDLPPGLAPGTYYLGVVVRHPGDSNPLNNVSNGLPFQIVNQRPPFDLGITLDSLSTAAVGAGDPIDITYTATGDNRLTGTFLREVWLSTDGVITDQDILISDRAFDINEGNAAINSTENIIPIVTAPGEYFVGVTVTREGDTNPANNVSAVLPLSVVTQRRPFDIGVRLIDVQPRTVAPGDPLDVSYEVLNPNELHGEYVRTVVISTDAQITAADTVVNNRVLTILGGNAQVTSMNNVVPADLAPGAYFVGVFVTTAGDTSVADNFSAALPIQVGNGGGPGPAGLTISNLRLNASAAPGNQGIILGNPGFNFAAPQRNVIFGGAINNSARLEIRLTSNATQNVCSFLVASSLLNFPGQDMGSLNVPLPVTLFEQNLATAGQGNLFLTLIGADGERSNTLDCSQEPNCAVAAEPLCAPGSAPREYIVP